MTYRDISATARWHVIDRVGVSTVAVTDFSAKGLEKLQGQEHRIDEVLKRMLIQAKHYQLKK